MTTRGFKDDEFKEVASIIIDALSNKDDEERLKELDTKVLKLTRKFEMK